MSRRKCLYIKVTRDEYELPLVVTDSAQEMAEKENTTVNAIYSAVAHYEAGRSNGSYRRVYLDGSMGTEC